MSTLKVDTLQNAVGENFVFQNKNLLINGGMNIWQRRTQKTNIDSGGYYTVDRINTTGNLTGGTGEFTQERSTDVPTAQGFNYSLKMDCTTADTLSTTSGFMTVRQRIEGQNLQHLLKGSSSAKKVTLSFWVKSSKTGTHICQLFDEDNTRSISKSYSVSSADTWEKKELTFDGDTTGAFDNDANRSLHVVWWLAAGTDYTSGSLGTSWATGVDGNGLANFVATGQVNLADSTSNEFYLTGLQLETGSVATDFEFEPFETTQRKCFRYAERLTSQNENLSFFLRRNTSDNIFQGWYNFKEPKRGGASLVVQTQPALTTNTPTADQFRMFNSSAWSNVTSTQSVSISGQNTSGGHNQAGTYTTLDQSRGMTIIINGITSGTTGQLASAEFQHADLIIDAEL